MWMYNAWIALDLARERDREANLLVQRHRLAALARGVGVARHQARVGRTRVLVAAALRAVSAWAHSIAGAACDAAKRVEGRTA